MRTSWGNLFMIGLATAGAVAQTSPAENASRKSESYATLKIEFEAELEKYGQEFEKEYEAAKLAGTLKTFRFSKLDQYPARKFCPRFLAIAERDPEGPNSVDALATILLHSDDGSSSAIRSRALQLLRMHHVTRPEIKRAIKVLVLLEQEEKDEKLVRDIVVHNPDRKVQFEVYIRRIHFHEQYINQCKTYRDNQQSHRAFEEATGKPFDINADFPRFAQLEKEIPDLKATMRQKYSDLMDERETIARKTAIGKLAPEVVAHDLAGKVVNLSSFKGKVVVLDVWATWCGACKMMIPHQRAMVERLKNKPFALVSISIDEEMEILTDFLAKEKMPWTQWWVGVGSSFGDAWDIRHYPTIYVVDADGVIRDKDLELRSDREAELDKAVDKLLKEMEQNPKKRVAG